MKRIVVLLVLIPLWIASCSRSIVSPAKTMIDIYKQVDYNKLENWAAHPYIKDPSDSVPYPLSSNILQDSSIDVFFLHPTTYFDKSLVSNPPIDFNSPLWNSNLTNKFINIKTDNSTILYQASIFNNAGRVFAPRYRQANYYAYFTRDTPKCIKSI